MNTQRLWVLSLHTFVAVLTTFFLEILLRNSEKQPYYIKSALNNTVKACDTTKHR